MKKNLLAAAIIAAIVSAPAFATNDISTPRSKHPLVSAPTATASNQSSNSNLNSNKNSNVNLNSARSQSRSSAVGVGVGVGGRGGNATATGGMAQGGIGVGSQGQSTNVEGDTVHVEATRRAASTAFAAPLTSSNDTCMGSSSGAIQGPGLGVSLGTTWTDSNCVMLKNSRELWNMGYKKAALARLCMDDQNRKALEQSGVACPPQESKSSGASATTSFNDDLYRN